jgi:hypothetical protein
MLLITFVELRVVDGRGRARVGLPHAVPGRPMLINTCYAMPVPRCAVALRGRFQNGTTEAWHGRGMASVKQTHPHRENQMEKTPSKPLASQHGRERHGNGMVCVN